jgi:hypothetical protein
MTKSLVAICVVATILPLQAQDAKPHTHVTPDPHDLWLLLKKALMATDGPEYFEMGLKGALLPPLVGRLVSATPTDHPSVLVLAMDGDKPQVTLRLGHGYKEETHLPSPIAAGSLITFEGVGMSFTQEPFMLTFEVDTDRVLLK